MPYISKDQRARFDELVDKFVAEIRNDLSSGDLNYLLSSLVWKLFQNNKSYSSINQIIGALECVKFEFYRRQAAPYEDIKLEANGDLI
jgi:hypothetical protein